MLLKLLDSEIGLLTQRQKNSGWTSWALVGALVGIALTLLGQWEAGWPTGETWLVAYVVLTFAAHAGLSLVRLLKGDSSKLRGITRFQFGLQRASRTMIALAFAQLSILCGVLFWADSFSSWSKWLVGSLLGLVSVLIVLSLGFLAAFNHVPHEVEPAKSTLKPTHQAISSVVGFGLGLIPLVMTSRDLLRLAPTALDIKVGCLFVAAGFLLTALLDEVNGQPVIDKLLRLRRELVLGGISIEEAAAQMEIELLGMRVSDVFRDSAIEFIKSAARISSRCAESIAPIDASGLLLPGGDGGPEAHSPQQRFQAQLLLEDCQPHLTFVVEELNKLGRSYRDIESRGRFFLRSTDDAQAAMNEILVRLVQSHQQAYASYQELERRMSRLSQLVTTPTGSTTRERLEDLPQGFHPRSSDV
jgi:hypothetical protein